MSFTSADYLPWLAAALALFQFVPARLRLAYLCAASYLFYAHGRAAHLGLLLGCTAAAYVTALGMGSARWRRPLFAASLASSLGPLVACKYFLADRAALPLGISFFTFQALSYSIDVYRRRIAPCRDPLAFAAYIAFFPQLVAGPIERAEHLLPQLRDTRRLSIENLSLGARRILWGLAKKQVFADRLRHFAAPLFADPSAHGAAELWIAAVALIAVLYADFSAYTDIARGSARLFGVELVANFERPFAAITPMGFWRRWHVSLWTWLIDYVYAPLARWRPASRLGALHLLLVLVLVGLWHGGSARFALWGLYNGLVVLAFQLVRRGNPAAERLGAWPPKLGDWLTWCATLASGAFSMVLFFAPDLANAASYAREMLATSWGAFVPRSNEPWLALGALAAAFAVHLAGELTDLAALWRRAGWIGRAAWLAGLAWVWLRHSAPQPWEFIYFQF